MQLSNFVIHRVDKDASSEPKPFLARKLIKISDRVEKFTARALKALERKPNRIYAPFHKDIENYPFSQRCRRFFHDEDFMDFSRHAVRHLAHEMRNNASTGGYIIFASYLQEEQRMILVIMLSKEQGYAVDDKTLQLKDSPHLDFSEIDKAATICGGPKDGRMPEKPLTYAGFRKSLSKYFQEFLGPDRLRNPRGECKQLIQIVDQFFEDQNVASDERMSIKAWLETYAAEQASKGEDIEISALSAKMWPTEPDRFARWANDNGLSAFVPPDIAVFQGWQIIEYKSKQLSLRFQENAITSRKIEYSEDDNSLIIHDVPKEVADRARRILANMRGENVTTIR